MPQLRTAGRAVEIPSEGSARLADLERSVVSEGELAVVDLALSSSFSRQDMPSKTKYDSMEKSMLSLSANALIRF
jgi:hypothetical protein